MITRDRLHEVLDYNPQSGIFIWKINKGYLKKGAIAGGIKDSRGYHQIGVDRKRYHSHRLAWLYEYGEIDSDKVIDHIDGNKSNNAIYNLRLCTQAENTQNRKSSRKGNSTGVLGVSLSGRLLNPYKVAIQLNGKLKHIGMYPTLQSAEIAYIAAKRKYHTHNTL